MYPEQPGGLQTALPGLENLQAFYGEVVIAEPLRLLKIIEGVSPEKNMGTT